MWTKGPHLDPGTRDGECKPFCVVQKVGTLKLEKVDNGVSENDDRKKTLVLLGCKLQAVHNGHRAEFLTYVQKEFENHCS